MAIINIPCGMCGHMIRVQIDTIDRLRDNLAAMERDRDYYKQKCAALEMLKSKRDDPLGDLLRGMGMS